MPFKVQNSWNYWKSRLPILQAYFFRGTLSAETFAIKNYCGIYFCNWGMKKYVFELVELIFWKKCRIDFCDPNVSTKFFQPSLEKKIYTWEQSIRLSYREIYFVKIYTPCCHFCGVMNFSVYWNDDYTSTVFFIKFFNIWSQLLKKKKKKILKENVKFVFAIGFQTVFWGTIF